MGTAYVGIGANLGDRAGTFRRAVVALRAGVAVTGASRVYETAPVGNVDQPPFLNAVLRVETGLSARALLDALLGVEQAFGRVRKQKWGPRTLDLDLLVYGDVVLREEGLVVPHPHLHERAFVLLPMCDLNPEGVHPVLGLSFRTLARRLDGTQAACVVEGWSLLPDEDTVRWL